MPTLPYFGSELDASLSCEMDMKFALFSFLNHDLLDVGVDPLCEVLVALLLEGVGLLLHRFSLATGVRILFATFLLVLEALHLFLI